MWTDISKSNFPEKMLWLSVLRRSIFDYVLYKGVGRHRMKWQRASQYLFGRSQDNVEELSFDDICFLFGWEPDYVRRLTRKLTRADLEKIETTKFRDGFLDECASFVEVLRFDQHEVSVPFFPPYNYAKTIRDHLALRRVQRKRHMSIPLLSGPWQAAAAV